LIDHKNYKFGNDVFPKQRTFFSFLLCNIGVSSKREILGSLFYTLIPFTIAIVITWQERNLFWGSVTAKIGDYIYIHGMSFLGDTMVWPYLIWLPVCLSLLKLAIHRSIKLLNKVIDKSSHDWICSTENKHNFNSAYNNTLKIFNHSKGKLSRLLAIIPGVIFVLIWSYNTITCTFNEYSLINVNPFNYPYKQNSFTISFNNTDNFDGEGIVDNITKEFLKEYHTNILSMNKVDNTNNDFLITTDKKINLPKWDTDYNSYTLSNLLSRFLSVLVYIITPFLLTELAFLIWGTSSFLLYLRRWEKQNGNKKTNASLQIEPFAEDGFGGLAYLANTGMSYLYVIIATSVLLVLSFIKETVNASWHDYLLLLLFLPAAILSFLIPTLILRGSIINAKYAYLKRVSNKLNGLSGKALDNNTIIDAKETNYKVNTLYLFYKKGLEMPEWPLTYTTIFRLIITVLSPAAILIIEMIIRI
jgi:hypothetical protein